MHDLQKKISDTRMEHIYEEYYKSIKDLVWKKPDVLVQLGNKKKEQKQQWFALKWVYKENMTEDDGYIYHR